jgi:PAS domain S-box-containing protein
MFELAFEANPSGMLLVDDAGKIVILNAEAERLFGYARDELIGQPVEILVPERFRAVHPAKRAAFKDESSTRRIGHGGDLFALRKDETEFQVEIGLTPIRTARGALVLSVITDVSERKLAEEALADHARDLQRSNADLEQFAYVAAHDLQEPLRMVASYTELLGERYRGRLDERADKYIRYAVEGAKRMQQLVNDLLAFSRVGTQGKPPRPTRSDVAVNSVLDALRGRIAETGAQVVCGALPMIDADEVQLRQLFQNLVGNALKFRGSEPPVVQIDAIPQGGRWLFSITDNGIGIEPEYAEKVFQMFQRLHERGKYDGSGIGLAIAKKIVERHGGRIWFASEPGKGTTFYFTFPASKGDPR